MRPRHTTAIAPASGLVIGIAVTAQERLALTTPNGVVFSESKDYATWQVSSRGGLRRPTPRHQRSFTGVGVRRTMVEVTRER